MLVFKCKIKILIIYQLTHILYNFKANSLYFKYSWIIKAKQTSLAHINWKCHSSWEINIPLTLRVRGILISHFHFNMSFSNNIAHSVCFAIILNMTECQDVLQRLLSPSRKVVKRDIIISILPVHPSVCVSFNLPYSLNHSIEFNQTISIGWC